MAKKRRRPAKVEDVVETKVVEKKGPQKITNGYFYQFGDRYRITTPSFIVNLTKQGRIIRLEKNLFTVSSSFIFDKIIGEKI